MKPKLEIGPGNIPHEGYKTLDIRPLPHIDYVADASKPLPFEDGEFSKVLACHVIEHFSHRKTLDILKEWGRIIETGGEIELHCPDMEYVCKKYVSGEIGLNVAVLMMYASQEYEFDFHFTGFDLLQMTVLLEIAGFHNIRRINRQTDDDGWQLKVVATKRG